MARTISATLAASRRVPLAICIPAFFGIAAPAAMATGPTTWPVTSCNDDADPGTLRNIIGAFTTVSGDTIDLSGLACPASTITLATDGDHILISQASLTIKGPPGSTITIDGSALDHNPSYNYSNVLYHTGGGDLIISNVTLTGGHQTHSYLKSLGGCLYSAGNVNLTDVTVTQCSAYSQHAVKGGGVYAKGMLTLDHSTISSNTATSLDYVLGGGAYAHGDIFVTGASSVTGNTVEATSFARGGGLYTYDITLTEGAVVTSNVSTSTGGDADEGGGVFASIVGMSRAALAYNSASSTAADALGGGIYAYALKLYHSFISKNVVKTTDMTKVARGGGAFMNGGDSGIYYSTVSGNEAQGPGVGGGLSLAGRYHVIESSAVTDNVSENGNAGVVADGMEFLLINSTISGNHAANAGGGLYFVGANAFFYNSTIAFNTSAFIAGPGVRLAPGGGGMAVTLQSTLMSNNTAGPFEDDLDRTSAAVVFNGGDLATAANNLIRVTTIGADSLPSDTLFGVCPHLGPLRLNGGLTKTHALMSGSVAIDSGNNAFGAPNDQRGPKTINGTLDYLRASGPIGDPDAKADIGAYEVQQDEIVYTADFEDCAPPF